MTQLPVTPNPRPWWVAVVSGMASYIDATAIVSFGIAIVIYQEALGLSLDEVGWASGALTFGIALGALVGGRLGDLYGRRPVFTFTMLLIILGASGLVFFTSFPIILISAALVGIGTGADLPVSLATISEAADDTNRGKLLGFSNLLWILGIVAAIGGATVVGSFGRLGGQILFGHIGVVALLVLLARLTIPESKVWQLAREERHAGVRTIRADRATATELLRGPYLVPFLALIVFYSFVNLAFNTIGQFGTYLLVNAGGLDIPTASLVGLVSIPLVILGYLWFMRIADTPRRFTYFKVGAVIFVVAQLIPAVFGFSAVTYLITDILAVAGLSFAGETIMKVWAQEQFPSLLRSTAQGAILAVARVLAGVLAIVTPLIIEIGPGVLYTFLAVVSAIGFATVWAVFRRRDRHNEFDEEMLPDPAPVSVIAEAPGK